MPPASLVRLSWPDGALLAEFAAPLRCLSSAALNGGLSGSASSWLAVQAGDEALSADDAALCVAEAAIAGGADPRAVVGTITAADVRAAVRRDHGPATAVAAVGADVAVLVAVDQPLGETALVELVQAATAATVHAIAATRVRGAEPSGAAGLAVCVAAVPGPGRLSHAAGGAVALAVHGAVRSGARVHQRTLRALGEV